jgi:hypothetical protein
MTQPTAIGGVQETYAGIHSTMDAAPISLVKRPGEYQERHVRIIRRIGIQTPRTRLSVRPQDPSFG